MLQGLQTQFETEKQLVWVFNLVQVRSLYATPVSSLLFFL